MRDVFDVALTVVHELRELGLPHCVIGGVAIQAWGESRVTRDVDVSVLTGFGDEASVAKRLLEKFPPRSADALTFALVNRVLLCQSPEGIGIDIGLAAFPYEEDAIARARPIELVPGIVLPIVCAEDLVTMKVFAGRTIDWRDVRGILVRQGARLDWSLIDATLPPLLEALEEPKRLNELHRLREELA